MTQASDREAAEHASHVALGENKEDHASCVSRFTYEGFLAGIAHARREMEGEMELLRLCAFAEGREVFREQVKAYAEALEFYADEKNMQSLTGFRFGRRAREVLNKYGSKE